MDQGTALRSLIGCCAALLATASLVAAESPGANLQKANDPLARQPDFLPVDEAFVLSAKRTGHRVVVRWDMPAGYYLYRHAFALTGDSAGPPAIPDGKRKVDEFFGESEVYYGHVEIAAPIRKPTAALAVRVTYQGCADYGLCYPPQHRRITFIEDGTAVIGKADASARALVR